MHGRSQRHKHVPDGVGERYHPVRLEEEHPQAVDQAAARQLMQALRVALPKEEEIGRQNFKITGTYSTAAQESHVPYRIRSSTHYH